MANLHRPHLLINALRASERSARHLDFTVEVATGASAHEQANV